MSGYGITEQMKDQIRVNENDINWMKRSLKAQTKLLYAVIAAIVGGFGTLIGTILSIYNSILKELI